MIRVPTAPGEALRVLHSSFVDFITKERCTDSHFLVDVRFREVLLAQHCLELITNSLRQNLAEIEDETADFEGRVKKVLPSQLQYASLHWALHMMAIKHADENMSVVDALVYPWELAKMDGRYEPSGGGATRDSDDAGHTCVDSKWELAGLCSNRRSVDIEKEFIGL